MRKLSLNQLCTPKWSYQEDIEATVRAGLQGISIHRNKLEPMGVAPIRQAVRDAGLEVASYLSTGRFLYEGQLRQRIEQAKRDFEVAAELGAECIVMLTGPQGQLTWDEATARFVGAVQEIMPVAERYGVRMALEPVTAAVPEHSYLHTLADALAVAEMIDSPLFGLVLDVWYCWWERDLRETLRRAGEKLFIVQICDHNPASVSMYDRAMLGEGILPIRRVLREIDESGYQGYWDIEVFSTLFTEDERRRLLHTCRDAFNASFV